MSLPTDEYVKSILLSAGSAKSGASRDGDSFRLDDQIFRTVGVQLQALGLVDLEYTQTTTGGMGLFWSITPSGNRLMLELRTVKARKASG